MRDIRYGFRMLVKNPVFSLVAVLTLALGIGANTAIYTVVEAVLLDPLPFDDPGELTRLWTRNDAQNQDKYMVSPMDFDDWRNMNVTFESMAAYWPTTGTVTEADGNPTRVRVVYTTEDFFDVLGASAARGRAFTGDDGPGSTQVAILSDGFWRRRFGGDPNVIGQGLILDGSPLEIIGIVRAEQTYPLDTDVWTNMTWGMQIQSRGARWMSAIGRLADDTDIASARSDLTAVASRIERENPESNRGWSVSLASLRDELVGDTRTALLILLGATAFILLIACANVANLLLSRSEVRAQEIAIRVAFGAGRGRLIRQLVTESLMLAGAGALVGLVFARVGVGGLLRLAPVTLPREEGIALDGTVLLAVLGMTLLTGVLFGLAPIWRLLRSDVHTAIRNGRRSTVGAAGHGLQNTFVVAQLAMALMLVVGAGLLLRSFENLRSVDTGLIPSGVLTMELDLATSVAENDEDVIDFYEEFERRLGALPGVSAVGDATTLPLAEANDYNQPFRFVDLEMPAELEARAFLRPVSPGFLEAMGTPVVRGRAFDPSDRRDAPGVALVNEAFARRYSPDADLVGERFADMRSRYGPLGGIHLAGDIRESEIVGIVKDVTYDGLRSEAVPSIYLSGLQTSIRRRTIAVRTSGEPAALLPAVRRDLASMNAAVALTNIRTMTDVLTTARSRDRFSTLLLSMFGAVALVLASIGVYGVLAYAVERRTSEMGIRMALGADRGSVRALVLRGGLRLVLIGLGAGVVGALALSGFLSTQLYGVEARDPWVFGSVAAVLLGVGFLASLLPALRATRVDPIIAMRAE